MLSMRTCSRSASLMTLPRMSGPRARSNSVPGSAGPPRGAYDVMHVEHEDVLTLGEFDDLAADERPTREVEQRPRVSLADAPRFLRARIDVPVMAEIRALQREVDPLEHALLRLSTLGRENGAQILVPRNDDVEGAIELIDIEVAMDGDRARDVVPGAVRLELGDEPEPLLREAQGQPVELRPVHR